MNPNFALRRLADRVQPDEAGMRWVQDHFTALDRRVVKAFPRSRLVPVGSYRRGTAIAVHSNVDTLVVLPREWATWGARRVPPQMIIERLAQDLADEHCTAGIRRDGRAVELSFRGVIHLLVVTPAFSSERSNHHPVYLVPGADLRWVEVSPQGHDALFAQANRRSGGKLRAISRLIKTWGVVVAPAGGISSLYIDMMLATSGIASGVKSYGDCLNEFLNVLVQRQVHGLSDPAGGSGVILASSSIGTRERLSDVVKAAANQARAALDSQTRGENASARRQWKALFRKRCLRESCGEFGISVRTEIRRRIGGVRGVELLITERMLDDPPKHAGPIRPHVPRLAMGYIVALAECLPVRDRDIPPSAVCRLTEPVKDGFSGEDRAGSAS
jgi:hypothetical protein